MDLNTHAHEIIRTWLFSRVVRAHFENGTLPWARSMISGFVVDPDRKKMSKSKGNAVVPSEILEKFGSDAVRWRAAMARPGMDSPFDESQMKVGRRLAIKVLNASKFVSSFGATSVDAGGGDRAARPGDAAALRRVIDEATAAFDAYDYTGALEVAERFFWTFCDDYVELVKERAYGGHGEAGCELGEGRAGRRAVGPAAAARAVPAVRDRGGLVVVAGRIDPPDELAGRRCRPRRRRRPTRRSSTRSSEVLAGIRGAKSTAQVSMKTEVSKVEVSGPAARLALAEQAEVDLRAAGRITGEIVWSPDESDSVSVVVAL